jgi:peptidoglycan/LPS O-acetylase OafA/YrhL
MSLVSVAPQLDRSIDTARADASSAVRADIQALRALAVGLVVVFHFWPQRVTGGFVGVDVFFVISGFLITSHLISKPPRRARDLAEFWGRRIRRLLPASFLVLAVTLAATAVIAPVTMWENVAKQSAAAALYVENWFLASEAVDYLAADNAATPVQHFWSLSIEEQFYLVWPVVLLLAVWLAAKSGRRQRVMIGGAVALIVLASFAVSLIITEGDPAAAYFVSWTRAWELGVGALAACVFPWAQERLEGRDHVRTALAYFGLAMIVWSALAYSGATPFPGSLAAVPVVGTAIVILAAVTTSRWSPLRPMAVRPVQLVGDLSYSIYLWHWPFVILLPLALGHSMTWYEKVLAIGVVIGLSWLTKVWVEDRFRGRRPLGVPARRSFVFAAAGMVALCAAAFAMVFSAQSIVQRADDEVEQKLVAASTCVGAEALVDESCDPHGESLITPPVFAAQDKPDPYADECWILRDLSEQKTCHYGSDAPDAVQVALIGNSHGGHWLPALQAIAERENWSITTYLISECYTVDRPIDLGTPARTENCLAWNKRVIDDVSQGVYDLAVISNRTARSLEGLTFPQTLAEVQADYADVLQRWADADVPVLVLRDTPYAVDLKNVPDCVAANLDDLAACDGGRGREQVDPLAAAAAALDDPRVGMLDLTDRICRDDVCYSVVGGVIVYFDAGHLSATFSRGLAEPIATAANDLLRRS